MKRLLEQKQAIALAVTNLTIDETLTSAQWNLLKNCYFQLALLLDPRIKGRAFTEVHNFEEAKQALVHQVQQLNASSCSHESRKAGRTQYPFSASISAPM
ncbi:hypothetical protein PR048_021794 [Dryococelus australis]|uniref:Uncharacterized protein n=1 Tax=Dryococelus australis TaxID=614101 RepID=A0ABQ9GZ97_9NEOP|nr:hypothetical protein PR048_021794 [Dryococelus australis]